MLPRWELPSTSAPRRHIQLHPKALPGSPEGTSSLARSVRTTRLLRADETGCAFGCAHSGSTTSGVSNAGALLPPLFRMMFTTPTASVIVMFGEEIETGSLRITVTEVRLVQPSNVLNIDNQQLTS